jgi:hypothetical protein
VGVGDKWRTRCFGVMLGAEWPLKPPAHTKYLVSISHSHIRFRFIPFYYPIASSLLLVLGKFTATYIEDEL